MEACGAGMARPVQEPHAPSMVGGALYLPSTQKQTTEPHLHQHGQEACAERGQEHDGACGRQVLHAAQCHACSCCCRRQGPGCRAEPGAAGLQARSGEPCRPVQCALLSPVLGGVNKPCWGSQKAGNALEVWTYACCRAAPSALLWSLREGPLCEGCAPGPCYRGTTPGMRRCC